MIIPIAFSPLAIGIFTLLSPFLNVCLAETIFLELMPKIGALSRIVRGPASQSSFVIVTFGATSLR